jgi:hypothetical protein
MVSILANGVRYPSLSACGHGGIKIYYVWLQCIFCKDSTGLWILKFIKCIMEFRAKQGYLTMCLVGMNPNMSNLSIALYSSVYCV